ncbi:hypothetical protein BDW02DRAFT_573909 [Decorospora gaudefroyi]|uniref:Uncharacterized protein n=1 Tax=Decorospora gaudefroyi TaxID=184978 RepID=A0A6A5JXE1_9PLEO|nr:hypothetical protein BDW02DRAFT_573909 [Decorospora gaudefroyi]
MLSIRKSVDSLSSRLSGEKPLPRPHYYCKMNPEEQVIWAIIVSRTAPILPYLLTYKDYLLTCSQGEEKYEYRCDAKGKVHKRRLSYVQRAQKQREFFDSRVGHAIVGDEWMRMQLPTRKR